MTPKTPHTTLPNTADVGPKRAWRKPVVRVHGNLATLTRAKDPNGADSGLGVQVS